MADLFGRKLGLRSIGINPATWGKMFKETEPAVESITHRTADIISVLESFSTFDRQVALNCGTAQLAPAPHLLSAPNLAGAVPMAKGCDAAAASLLRPLRQSRSTSLLSWLEPAAGSAVAGALGAAWRAQYDLDRGVVRLFGLDAFCIALHQKMSGRCVWVRGWGIGGGGGRDSDGLAPETPSLLWRSRQWHRPARSSGSPRRLGWLYAPSTSYAMPSRVDFHRSPQHAAAHEWQI